MGCATSCSIRGPAAAPAYQGGKPAAPAAGNSPHPGDATTFFRLLLEQFAVGLAAGLPSALAAAFAPPAVRRILRRRRARRGGEEAE
ncbi:hypothetical protein [Streptomyces sp. NPDC058739]|uniref:hypothetical protein n=1 Tax=Streptomyces sp. NPDC058739 TaxID=3346618 RepID=UPI0036747F7B